MNSHPQGVNSHPWLNPNIYNRVWFHTRRGVNSHLRGRWLRAGAVVEGGCPTGGCRTHGLTSLLADFMSLLADSMSHTPAARCSRTSRRLLADFSAPSHTSLFRRLAAGCLPVADLQSSTHPKTRRRRSRHPRLSQRCPSSRTLPAYWATAAQPHHTSIFSPPGGGPDITLAFGRAQEKGKHVCR